jgi:hypothetical protein
MRRLISLLILALFAAATPARADTTRQQMRALQEQAVAAYKAGNFTECAKDFAAALALRPHHPRLLYNFAACSAKGGNANDAIRTLNEYADMGLIADVEKDDDFAALKDQAAFKAVLAKFAANGKLVGTSQIVATISGPPFLAEGIAYDSVGKRFFISSVDQRKIVQIATDGTATDFVPSARDGLLGAFGMAIDTKRQLLWVATSGVAHARNLTDAAHRTMGIASFSLQGRRLTTKSEIEAKDLTTTGVIGDIFVGPNDRIYATDSVLPRIYLFPAVESHEPPSSFLWMDNEAFVSLQGMTTTPDEKSFIIADYAMGLHFVSRETMAIETLGFADGTTLLGIDGLYRNGNTLLAVQNGVNPQRILAMQLDASGRSIASVKVLSANDPNIPEPSLGTLKGDDFCVVANAQWSRFNDDGTRKRDLDPPRIACLSIPIAQR